MSISMESIKELRNATGVSISECKKALEASDGNVDAAIDELRKKGVSKASKRAENETNEGVIKIRTFGNIAYVAAMTSETDFVAKNEAFHAVVESILDELEKGGNTEAIEQIKTDAILKLGENMRVKYAEKIEGEILGVYTHGNSKLAAIVSGTADEEILRNIAMHVTAMNPTSLSPDDISDDIVAKEKEIQLETMKQDPVNEKKTENILEKIIEGKMRKFVEENSLLTQKFVMDPSKTVKEYLGSETISAFYRFSI